MSSVKLDKRTKSVIANIKEWSQSREAYFDMTFNEGNINKCYALIRDLSGQFTGGEYIVELEIPEKYPFAPPKFYFATPNGVYDTNKEVCLSNGHFHKENHKSAEGLGSFVSQLASGMIFWENLGNGISILHSDFHGGSAETKKKLLPGIKKEQEQLALMSHDFNKKYFPELIEKFHSLPLNQAYKNVDKLIVSDNIKRLVRRYITAI